MKDDVLVRTIYTCGCLALLVCAGVARPLAAQDAQSTKPAVVRPAEGLLFVGSDDNEPYSFLDETNEPVGYDVDVMSAIAKKTGRKITVKLMDAKTAKQTVLDGVADGLIGLGIISGEEDPRDRWTLCGPTVSRKYRVLGRNDSAWAKQVSDHELLDGARVALLAGDPVHAMFENSRTVTIVDVRRPQDGCLWVERRRVAAFLADANTILYGAGKGAYHHVKFVGQPVYEITNYGPAVPADKPPALAADITQAIKEMSKPKGKLQTLQDKWFAHRLAGVPLWRQLWFLVSVPAVACVLLLGLASVVWRRQFRARVEERTRKLQAEAEVLRKQLSDLRAGQGAERIQSPDQSGPLPVVQAAPVGVTAMPLNEFLQSHVRVLEEAVGGGISLSIHLSEEMPAVLADAEQVRAMLVNLCTNARDAIHQRRASQPDAPARVWVTTRIARSEEKPPNVEDAETGFVALGVRDSGCGIDQALVQQIFQVGYTTKGNAAGHGLAFVYEAVAQHGGWIDVESARERGATFSIYLPAAEV